MKQLTVYLEAFKQITTTTNGLILALNVGVDFTSDIRKQNFEIGSRTSSTGRVDKTEFTTFQTDAILNLTGGDDITDKLTLNYLLAI